MKINWNISATPSLIVSSGNDIEQFEKCQENLKPVRENQKKHHSKDKI
jgi:hypothetical protein